MSSLRDGSAAPPNALTTDIVEIARIPAPTFDERLRVEWLERRLADQPGTRTRDAAGNLVWRFSSQPPSVLVSAHIDTVFARNEPLTIRQTDERLIGPGVGDNAAAIATLIDVFARLLAEGEVDMGGAAAAFTVGEEGFGNLHGAYAVCEELRPHAFIALEGHGLESVGVDAIGSLRARVSVEGPGGHSWVDRGKPSALHAVIKLASDFFALGDADAPVNIGVIAGGRSVNAIAADAHFLVEIRALDESRIDAFSNELRNVAVRPPLTIRVEEEGRRPAGRLDDGAPLLSVVNRVRGDLGLPPALSAVSTDANAALALAVPALSLGVASGEGMHTLNEWIDVSSLRLGWLQLHGVVSQLLSSNSTAPGHVSGAMR